MIYPVDSAIRGLNNRGQDGDDNGNIINKGHSLFLKFIVVNQVNVTSTGSVDQMQIVFLELRL